jgi:hypothetical protein
MAHALATASLIWSNIFLLFWSAFLRKRLPENFVFAIFLFGAHK